jgi:hypothetical protein
MDGWVDLGHSSPLSQPILPSALYGAGLRAIRQSFLHAVFVWNVSGIRNKWSRKCRQVSCLSWSVPTSLHDILLHNNLSRWKSMPLRGACLESYGVLPQLVPKHIPFDQKAGVLIKGSERLVKRTFICAVKLCNTGYAESIQKYNYYTFKLFLRYLTTTFQIKLYNIKWNGKGGYEFLVYNYFRSRKPRLRP